jgi:glyoxylase I family protein
MSFAIQKINHFAYRCKDAEETRHFYEDILGLPLLLVVREDYVPSTGEYNPYAHALFQMADGSCIAFFDLGDNIAPEPSPNTPAWVNHIALEVADREQLLAAKTRLEDHGIPVLGVTDHGIMNSIYFFDPNGLRVELTTWTVDADHIANESHHAREKLDAWALKKRGLALGQKV